MNRNSDDDTDQEIATAEAAGQTIVSRLREAEKQLTLVLNAIDEYDELTDVEQQVLELFGEDRQSINVPTAAATTGLPVDGVVAALEELDRRGYVDGSTVYELTGGEDD